MCHQVGTQQILIEKLNGLIWFIEITQPTHRGPPSPHTDTLLQMLTYKCNTPHKLTALSSPKYLNPAQSNFIDQLLHASTELLLKAKRERA